MDAETKAQRKLHKGETVTVRIASLASGGEGVSRDLGVPVFVNRVAAGDLVEIKLFDVRKDFARGEIVNIIEPSPSRVEPPCKLFKVCGGCQWQHIGYSHQLDAKTDIVKQAIKHIGKLPPDLVLPTIGAVEPLFYRNKVQFPVDYVSATGRILAGYYKQNSHELVNIKHCPVQPEPLDRVLAAVKDAVENVKLTVYNEKTGRGMLRHIAERYSFAENRVLLTLVINSEPEHGSGLQSKLDSVATEVMQAVPEVIGVCVNYNTARGNRIIGDVTKTIAGDAHIVEVLRSNLPDVAEKLHEGIRYQLSSTSFFQVNSKQAAVLLDQVMLAAAGGMYAAPTASGGAPAPSGGKIPLILDAYAGVGTMALWLSAIADKVLAIEEWPAAVADGRVNQRLNGISNVEFIEGQVEDVGPRLVSEGLHADVVVVDPPRKGLHPEALQSIVGLGPRRIVYVSCNPATLARDLRILEDSGYKTMQIQPVDMFPETYHIESVTVVDKAGS